jgi:peptidyl-tRNA hydrolase, PTH1 family
MKVVMGLGNPGPDYDGTRHNVGWWLLDRLAHDWGFGSFRQEGPALVSAGHVGGHAVVLVKPLTWMNRSGAALLPFLARGEVDPAADLLVVVDDATREVGGVRFRPGGSAGGHNGLRSIEGTLGSRDYPRLRIGVGRPPSGADMAAWVLSAMDPEDEDTILCLLPELVLAVETWIDEGVQVAMDRYNR